MALTKRERKDRLRDNLGIQKRVAEKLGVSPSTVSFVANGKTQLIRKKVVREIQVALAEEIGETVEEFWGSAAA